ncbi:ECF-type sigma factor [Dokdonella sp.]|uniref:ECF-type sigma factor n=1 Tax=Dokdonella sp. TaxID=2291710 RepID=UPI0025B8D348|nr:ECF-type sigma factor [Dokdonella sp.]MBX3688423.1 sigma-70 family RNA polymerase sigma factor [Dokdonella sp.]
MHDPNHHASALLEGCARGDQEAYDTLFGLVYADLRRRARALNQDHAATLSTTALVHEAYLSLAGAHLALNDQAHFFRIAARAMRRILIDASRRRNADKRGNGMESLTLDPDLAMQAQDLDLFALDQALEQLAVAEPRMAQVVELHFYAGLEFVAIAQMMELSERTVARDWRTARALLLQSLGDIAAAQP